MNDWFHMLERAVEAARNGILITDPNQPDNPIVYANPGFERLTGYSAEEAIGRNCRFLQGADRDQPVLDEIRAALREERECRVVVRNYRKDGTLFWQALSISPVRDEDGRLTHFVGVQDDITERKMAEEKLAYQALHDPLTDLPNRVLFMERLQHALLRVARHQESIAVLFLDLDNFKDINDRFGHEVGDQLLVAVAKRLKGYLRSVDTAARLGGDEFMVLLDKITDEKDATRVADRILEGLRTPFASEEGALSVAASIGIALSTHGSENRPRELLRFADRAMYQSKRKGKSHYTIFEPNT